MHPLAIADLARSGITPDQADAVGIFDVDRADEVYPEFWPVRALVISYFNPDHSPMMFEREGKLHRFCRVRYLEPLRSAKGFVKDKDRKYDQPRGSGQRVYFCPLVDWVAVLANPEEPVVITEGEKKTIAGCYAGLPVIGLGGVFNFMASLDSLLTELEVANWQRRDVYIGFDSDAATNPSILTAEARLVDQLQRKRGARCYLVRLPQNGDAKCGLDDYLLQHGAQGVYKLLESSPSLGALDSKVVALNEELAWIERENLVWDLKENTFIRKDALLAGSRFSSVKHITMGMGQRSAPKEIQVAKEWLTHPHAQRFTEILFRPGEGRVVTSDFGSPALNMWQPWETEPGDVEPFLELTRYLFQNLPPQHRDLPLKLLAYKAQNLEKKIPLAIVLIGEQGCGKTLWGECVRDAFMPYAVDCTPSSLSGEFQGWLERSFIALVNEAKGEDMIAAAETLKALISDVRRPMNEKFRPVRQVNTYTQYIITSNRHEVGAFSADDRRMIVVECPRKLTTPEGEALYTTLGRRNGEWYHGGGPKHLLHYLLNLDLGDWVPPSSAPLTAEKINAYFESLTTTERLAEQMKESTDLTVAMWLSAAESWAKQALQSSNNTLVTHANAVLQNIQRYSVRPWYTAEELARMFPAIAAETAAGRFDRFTPAGRVSRELRQAGIKYLRSADSERGFFWMGEWRQYLVISQFDEWAQPLRQADFERQMKAWPSWASYKGKRA